MPLTICAHSERKGLALPVGFGDILDANLAISFVLPGGFALFAAERRLAQVLSILVSWDEGLNSNLLLITRSCWLWQPSPARFLVLAVILASNNILVLVQVALTHVAVRHGRI
jgi:hypothetical protein